MHSPSSLSYLKRFSLSKACKTDHRNTTGIVFRRWIIALLTMFIMAAASESALGVGTIIYTGLAWKNPANLNRIKNQQFFSGTYLFNPQFESKGTYNDFGTLNGTINNSDQANILQDFGYAFRPIQPLVVQAYFTHPHVLLERPPKTGFQRRVLTSFIIRSYEVGGAASYQLLKNLAIGAKVGYTRASHFQLAFKWVAGPNIDTELPFIGEDHKVRFMLGFNYMPILGTIFDFSFSNQQVFDIRGATKAGGARAAGEVRATTPSVYQASLTQFLTKHTFVRGELKKEKWTSLRTIGPIPLPASVTGGTDKTWSDLNSKDSWTWVIMGYCQIKPNIGVYGRIGYSSSFVGKQEQNLGTPFPNYLFGGVGTKLKLGKGVGVNFYVMTASGDIKLRHFNNKGFKGESEIFSVVSGLELTFDFDKSVVGPRVN